MPSDAYDKAVQWHACLHECGSQIWEARGSKGEIFPEMVPALAAGAAQAVALASRVALALALLATNLSKPGLPACVTAPVRDLLAGKHL